MARWLKPGLIAKIARMHFTGGGRFCITSALKINMRCLFITSFGAYRECKAVLAVLRYLSQEALLNPYFLCVVNLDETLVLAKGQVKTNFH